MLKRTFYTLVIVVYGVSAHAQQDAQFTQYMFNHLYLTPAYSGVEGVTELTAIHRSQWAGYQSSFNEGGAPTTQLISFTSPIYKLKSGFGVYVMNDKLGPQNNLEANAMYAYHLGLRNGKLSFGVKLGVYSQSINYEKYRAIHPDDPQLKNLQGKESQVRPDVGFGAYYRAERYYLGVGVNHLTRAEFDFNVNDARNALANHLNFTAGYLYEVNFDVTVTPTILIKTDFQEYSFDLGVIATLKDKMWAGLSFRQSEAANLLLGYAFGKDTALRLGYAIDVVVKDSEAKENFSHELLLRYQLPVYATGKKVVRTPRYRH
jgi:type IX secretion system PorP/SprF family membrane protein